MIKIDKIINRILVGVLCIFYTFIGKAELWPTFSIVDLAHNADTVVEAEFLRKQNENYFFTIHSLIDNTKVDTLKINNINRVFEQPMNNRKYSQRISFENCDKLLIYLSKNESNQWVPAWSGYRLLKDGFIYFPFQLSNPGGFSFISVSPRDRSGKSSWDELKNRVQQVFERVEKIKNIKQIEDPNTRNQALFHWIDLHKESFGRDCKLNEDCGWGNIQWDVFKWITEGNISKDTWKASQLYRELFSYSILHDANGNSFKSYNDINFLIGISLDSNRTISERYQALNYLSAASRKVYENNYPIPDSTTLAFQKQMQDSIRGQLLPLLDNPKLNVAAFQIIRKLCNPRDGVLEHRIDLELLPLIISKYENEIPSSYRSDLAEFIVHNSSKEVWKNLTSCDEKIFMDLYQLRLDTLKSTVTFGINKNYGREPILEKPIIEIVDWTSNQIVKQIRNHEFELPYRNGSGVRYLEADISELNKGKYKIYVRGKAGEQSQYDWVSEYGVFIVE